MTKLVLLHKASSIYEDEPEVVYDFPKTYLRAMKEAINDWVIYYEPVKAGPRGYFAVARVQEIIPKPGQDGRFLALIEPNSYLPFDDSVPRLIDGRPLEAGLMNVDGSPKIGGTQQLAVRRILDTDFTRIIDLGLPEDLEEVEKRRYDTPRFGAAEAGLMMQRPTVERLTRRAYRDVAFRRNVREAYGHRCAFSGLRLRNGGGRPEVQAAHIRPVASRGSDATNNGLALSGTLHWMFDRGLISVADDRSILISHNKVPEDVSARLIVEDRLLRLPKDPRDWPSQSNLRWHRENVYGQALADDELPWR